MKTFFVLWIWFVPSGPATDHYDTLKECEAARQAIMESTKEKSDTFPEYVGGRSKCIEVKLNL